MKNSSIKTVLTRVLALLLVALMLIPFLASCSDETEVEDTIIPVYTFYGIKGEETSDDAIRKVELAINRILISRYTIAVDFRLFNEDEYEEALDEAIAEAQNYTPTTQDDAYTYTEDKIIEMLESGKDFELQGPRVDVMICKDADHYFRLANEGKLADIGTTLSNEGKILYEYIHPSLFELTKLNRKQYGVPNNSALGEYEYILFDTEYLDANGFDYQTVKDMEDLEEYLEIIKKSNEENNQNILPLKNAGSPKNYEYLFSDNEAFYINKIINADGVVEGSEALTTLDSDAASYLLDDHVKLISRFRSLGYMANADEKYDNFAVTFLKGTPADIEAFEKENGREYKAVIYKTPKGSISSLDTIYSLSSTIDSTEVTTVIDIIVSMFTDTQIKDYFYYGIVGEHYTINDDGLIEPIVNKETGKCEYAMENKYTGNIYIASLKVGDDEKLIEQLKTLNLSSALALSAGFIYTPKVHSVKTQDPDTLETHTTSLTEPNYAKIYIDAVKDSLAKLQDGSIATLDYKTFTEEIAVKLDEEAKKNVAETFSKSLIDAHMAQFEERFTNEEYLAKMNEEATKIVNEEYKVVAKSALTRQETAKLKTENPNITAEELEAKLAELITEAAIAEYIKINVLPEDIEKTIVARKDKMIQEEKDVIINAYIETKEYKQAYTSYIGTEEVPSEEYVLAIEEYKIQKDEKYVKDYKKTYAEYEYDIELKNLIRDEALKMHQLGVEAVEAEIAKFNAEAAEFFGWDESTAKRNLDVEKFSEFINNRIKKQYSNIAQ